MAPTICPPLLFSRNFAFSKLRKASFWHRPSVNTHLSERKSHFLSFGKPDSGTAHLSTPTFLEKYRIFHALESLISAPPICPPPLVSRNIAFFKLRKARFSHRPSVNPHFSKEMSHVPSFGKPDFGTANQGKWHLPSFGKPDSGTAHLSTPIFLKNYRISRVLESQILASPICPPPLVSRKIAFFKFRKARFWHRPSVYPHFSRELSHFPSFGRPDSGTAHLSTLNFLEKYRISQASESQILASPICPPLLFSINIAFSRLRKA